MSEPTHCPNCGDRLDQPCQCLLEAKHEAEWMDAYPPVPPTEAELEAGARAWFAMLQVPYPEGLVT